MTNMTPDTQAVVLLCSHFGKKSSLAPLTPTEYRKVAKGLWQLQKRPADLFDDSTLLDKVSALAGIDLQRLYALMGRRVEMGLAMEEWTRHGIWIMSKSDPDYPDCFRTHIKNNNPPLLYGIGNKQLLTCGGLGFVGSRGVDEEGICFTQKIARLCVSNAKVVISGGAKGVDKTSVEAALNENGYAVAIVADNLLKNSLSPTYRDAIASGHLLLLSPYYPNAPFSVGNAMGRNKLIYSLADFTLVVSSDYNKGGTWAGAKEELNRPNRKNVFVRIAPNVPDGNKKLLELGAISWPDIDVKDKFWSVLEKSKYESQTPDFFQEGDLFETSAKDKKEDQQVSILNKNIRTKPQKHTEQLELEPKEVESHNKAETKSIIFERVLPVLLTYMREPIAIDELANLLCVTKNQMAAWIKEAENRQYVHKFTRPTKYQAIEHNNLK